MVFRTTAEIWQSVKNKEKGIFSGNMIASSASSAEEYSFNIFGSGEWEDVSRGFFSCPGQLGVL